MSYTHCKQKHLEVKSHPSFIRNQINDDDDDDDDDKMSKGMAMKVHLEWTAQKIILFQLITSDENE